MRDILCTHVVLKSDEMNATAYILSLLRTQVLDWWNMLVRNELLVFRILITWHTVET